MTFNTDFIIQDLVKIIPTSLANSHLQSDELDPLTRATREKFNQLVEEQEKSPTLQGRVSPSTPPRVRSKFFADSEDGSEEEQNTPTNSSSLATSTDELGFITPTTSPLKAAAPKTTPETVKDLGAVFDQNAPGYDLTPESKKTVNLGLKKLDDLLSPHRSEQKAIVRKSFAAALERTGSTTEVPSQPAQRRLVFSSINTEDVSAPWTTKAARSLGVCIVDEKHLRELEHTGGFHICGEGHPLDRFVRLRRTNLLTGVWCGQVNSPKNPEIALKEFSSFIPRQMKFERFLPLMAQSFNNDVCKIAQTGNRRLYRIIEGEKSFVIECYFHEEGTKLRSAFAQFHYEVWNGKDISFKVPYSYQWSINDPVIPATFEVFYDHIRELIQADIDAIVYDTDDKIIVDVGRLYKNNPKYGQCPINQGFLVEIAKDLL